MFATWLAKSLGCFGLSSHFVANASDASVEGSSLPRLLLSSFENYNLGSIISERCRLPTFLD